MKFSVLGSLTVRFPFLSKGGMFSTSWYIFDDIDGVETASQVMSSAYLGSIIKGDSGKLLLFDGRGFDAYE